VAVLTLEVGASEFVADELGLKRRDRRRSVPVIWPKRLRRASLSCGSSSSTASACVAATSPCRANQPRPASRPNNAGPLPRSVTVPDYAPRLSGMLVPHFTRRARRRPLLKGVWMITRCRTLPLAIASHPGG
jgi:hypothetical protein